MDRSPHESGTVNVNGVNLHYLDWGGRGDTLLFLAGMGCNAHIFDDFAPRFCDKFHVMALTRRGHGESDHPETGYDVETLTEDLHQFLDAFGIDKVILAGHSMAGMELSHFTILYPDRVLKLIFLDAFYERDSEAFKDMVANSPWKHMEIPSMGAEHYSVESYNDAMKRAFPSFTLIWTEAMQNQSLHEVTTTAEGKVIDRMSPAIDKSLVETLNSYVPKNSEIKVPTLAFFALSKGNNNLDNDWMTEEQKAELRYHVETRENRWTRESITRFQKDIPHARVIEIPNGHHYCFIQQEQWVYDEMRRFLLEEGRMGVE